MTAGAYPLTASTITWETLYLYKEEAKLIKELSIEERVQALADTILKVKHKITKQDVYRVLAHIPSSCSSKIDELIQKAFDNGPLTDLKDLWKKDEEVRNTLLQELLPQFFCALRLGHEHAALKLLDLLGPSFRIVCKNTTMSFLEQVLSFGPSLSFVREFARRDLVRGANFLAYEMKGLAQVQLLMRGRELSKSELYRAKKILKFIPVEKQWDACASYQRVCTPCLIRFPKLSFELAKTFFTEEGNEIMQAAGLLVRFIDTEEMFLECIDALRELPKGQRLAIARDASYFFTKLIPNIAAIKILKELHPLDRSEIATLFAVHPYSIQEKDAFFLAEQWVMLPRGERIRIHIAAKSLLPEPSLWDLEGLLAELEPNVFSKLIELWPKLLSPFTPFTKKCKDRNFLQLFFSGIHKLPLEEITVDNLQAITHFAAYHLDSGLCFKAIQFLKKLPDGAAEALIIRSGWSKKWLTSISCLKEFDFEKMPKEVLRLEGGAFMKNMLLDVDYKGSVIKHLLTVRPQDPVMEFNRTVDQLFLRRGLLHALTNDSALIQTACELFDVRNPPSVPWQEVLNLTEVIISSNSKDRIKTLLQLDRQASGPKLVKIFETLNSLPSKIFPKLLPVLQTDLLQIISPKTAGLGYKILKKFSETTDDNTCLSALFKNNEFRKKILYTGNKKLNFTYNQELHRRISNFLVKNQSLYPSDSSVIENAELIQTQTDLPPYDLENPYWVFEHTKRVKEAPFIEIQRLPQYGGYELDLKQIRERFSRQGYTVEDFERLHLFQEKITTPKKVFEEIIEKFEERVQGNYALISPFFEFVSNTETPEDPRILPKAKFDTLKKNFLAAPFLEACQEKTISDPLFYAHAIAAYIRSLSSVVRENSLTDQETALFQLISSVQGCNTGQAIGFHGYFHSVLPVSYKPLGNRVGTHLEKVVYERYCTYMNQLLVSSSLAGKFLISLQEMVHTSLALKNRFDKELAIGNSVEFDKHVGAVPSSVFIWRPSYILQSIMDHFSLEEFYNTLIKDSEKRFYKEPSATKETDPFFFNAVLELVCAELKLTQLKMYEVDEKGNFPLETYIEFGEDDCQMKTIPLRLTKEGVNLVLTHLGFVKLCEK